MSDREVLFDARLERLRSWSMDEAHVVQSVRQHEPQYRNPAELRADVRELLARYDAVSLYRARVEGRTDG